MATVTTRHRAAVVDVGFTVAARDSVNTLTAISIDEINTRAIVLTRH